MTTSTQGSDFSGQVAGIRIFAMNDFDWYAAATADDALREMAEILCYPVTDEGVASMRVDYDLDDPEELSDEAMDRLKFYETDENDANDDTVPPITFRERLAQMIAAGDTFPCFFASTEI